MERHNENRLQCFEYYQKHYPHLTLEEQHKLHKEWAISHSPQNPEYYLRLNPELTIEEARALAKQKSKQIVNKRPQNTGTNNPGHRSRTTPEERRSRSPKCIEFYLKRYPNKTREECEEMRQQHLEYTRTKVTRETCIFCWEYWAAKGLSKSDAEQAALEFQRNKPQWSLKYLIEKYGEDEGRRRFDDRNQKWLEKLHKNFEQCGDGRTPQSKMTKLLFEILYKFLGIRAPAKEKFISYKDRHWALDFCVDKKVIEFHGDYWHANPNIYSPNFYNKSTGRTARETWGRDRQKLEDCKALGYDVLVVWEEEYNKFPEDVVEKCKEFLQP